MKKNKSEFDNYAENYDSLLADAIPQNLYEDEYFAKYKVEIIAKRTLNKNPLTILDFGCGAGRSLSLIERNFPSSEIFGFDVSTTSLNIANSRMPRAILFSDWSQMRGLKFDIIIAANVFHHIPPKERLSTLTMCFDILANDGKLYIFEHNPFNPLTRWIFNRCTLDKDAEMINMRTVNLLAREAGFTVCHNSYTLFFPKQLSYLRRIEPLLKGIPLGAQYYVQLEK